MIDPPKDKILVKKDKLLVEMFMGGKFGALSLTNPNVICICAKQIHIGWQMQQELEDLVQ